MGSRRTRLSPSDLHALRRPHNVFICHTSEDKDAIARPLAEALRGRGLAVWFDEFELEIGAA